MNAALVCPGPSLSRLRQSDLDRYSLTIGVNRATTAVRCSWQASIDLDFLITYTPDPPPRNLLTNAATRDGLIRCGNPWGTSLTVTTDELRNWCCPLKDAPGWTLYSASAALVLAGWLGAESVDVFGADWQADAADFDGTPAAGDRSVGRFKCEAQIWGRVSAWLAGRGVDVRRIGLGWIT